MIVFPGVASFDPVHILQHHTALFVCVLKTWIVPTVELLRGTETFLKDLAETPAELLNGAFDLKVAELVE